MGPYRAQARADFLEVYGVRLEDEAERDALYASDLAAMLPPSSRVWRAMRPDASVPDAATSLWALEYDVRCLSWGLLDGTGRRPAPLGAGGAASQAPSVEDMEEIADMLGIKR